MYDRFNRDINYLRISVTDRCNLRCRYCVPGERMDLMNQENLISFREIIEVVRFVSRNGIKKIRLTGGEPLMRKDIASLVRQISGVKKIEDLAMTTNGIRLPGLARELKEAGLHRVNISLDSLNPEKYREISRIGSIDKVFAGINAALDAGLQPVKINCVVSSDSSQEEREQLMEYCVNKGLEIRFIREMSLDSGEFYAVEGGKGGNCSICNRIRLTANGDFKPCLFSNTRYNIRELGIEKAWNLALENKPIFGSLNNIDSFYNIGG
jgi:GTP 3',8-cyclase